MTLYYVLCSQLIYGILSIQFQLFIKLLSLPLLHEAASICQECEGQSDIIPVIELFKFGPRRQNLPHHLIRVANDQRTPYCHSIDI